MSAEPADKKYAGVHGTCHNGAHVYHIHLGLDEHVVDVEGCLFELVVLKVFPHISLNNSDCRYILLNRFIQFVILLEHGFEVFGRPVHDKKDYHCKEQHRKKIDAGKFGTDDEAHYHSHYH